MRDPYLFIAVVVFAVYLVWQLVMGASRRHRRRTSGPITLPDYADDELRSIIEQIQKKTLRPQEGMNKILARARTLDSPQDRAAHYLGTAEIADHLLDRPHAAARFYLRALDEDPANAEALEELRKIMATSPLVAGRLEQACWKALARLPESEIGGKAWKRLLSSLAALYASSPNKVFRADAIERILKSTESDSGK